MKKENINPPSVNNALTVTAELYLALRSSHSWIKVPDHLVLMNEDKAFRVQVGFLSLSYRERVCFCSVLFRTLC